jgi:amidase
VVSRSVRDSAAAMDACQGPGLGDPYVIAPPIRPFLYEVTAGTPRLKIAVQGVPHSDGPVSKDCLRGLADTASLCADLGHEVIEAQPDLGVSWEAFMLANARVWCSNMAFWITGLAQVTGRKPGLDMLEATTLACYEYGLGVSAVQLHEAFDTLNRVSRSVAPFFEEYDLLLTPTLPDPPQPLGTFDADASGFDGLGWSAKTLSSCPYTPLFNTTGQPAMSVPLEHSSEGLPIGMQFVAKFGNEATLFRLAGQLEEARPWINRKPPVFAS